MSTTIIEPAINTSFENFESKARTLSNFTTIYKTLISHYTTLNETLDSQIETLDSQIQTLDSNLSNSLANLQSRADSIPNQLNSIVSTIETLKKSAIDEIKTPSVVPPNAPLVESLKLMCKKMDYKGLLKLAIGRRRESVPMRVQMVNALSECIDPPRLVLDSVMEFVEMKKEGKHAIFDIRWACAMVVGGLFPPDKVQMFSRAVVERAERVVRVWKEVADSVVSKEGESEGEGEGGSEAGFGMGPAEAAMFAQIVVGFGLKDMFDVDFYRKMVLEFSSRRDFPKLAVSLLGDGIGDVIDDLVKDGKQLDAVYFALESGLTKRFKPASLLEAFLQNSRNKATEIQKKGRNSYDAQDEANTYEINSIKSVIKCVLDYKLQSEFPLESWRKRVSSIERARANRRKGSSGGPRSSHKRTHASGPARGSGPPHRPAKYSKFSGPSSSSFGRRNPVPPAQQYPVSRYPGPHTYPSYYDAGITSSYGTNYGGSHIPPPAQIVQPQYGTASDGGSYGGQYGGSYGGQVGYGTYEYGTAAPPSYRPPYTQ